MDTTGKFWDRHGDIVNSRLARESVASMSVRALTKDSIVLYVYIDPPNGSAFGFPKRFDGNGTEFDQWLLANGYPEEWIQLFPDGMPCRMIESDQPIVAWES